MRSLATVVLGLVAAMNLLGVALMVVSWYFGLGFHARGGPAQVVASAVIAGLCLLAIGRLRRPAIAVR